MQKIGRKIVRSEPDVLYVADQDCVLHLFVPARSLDQETDNPPVVISVNDEIGPGYGDERCPVLPINVVFKVHLEAGDAVYAVSPGDSLVSFSAVPEVSR